MQSNDSQFSSDESVLEVCSVYDNNDNDNDYDDDDQNNNPWGDMDMQDIPLDIKDEQADSMSNYSSINSISGSSSPTVTRVKKGPDVIFSPCLTLNI